jgi:hypothetical protein
MQKYNREKLLSNLEEHIRQRGLRRLKVLEISLLLDVSPTYARMLAMEYAKRNDGWLYEDGELLKVVEDE